MERSKKSFFNAAFGLSNQIITLIIGLVIPRLFIMAYGSEMNGLQSSIYNIYTYIALLEAGIGMATIQSLYGPLSRNDRDEVSSVLSATNIQYKKIAAAYFVCMLAFSVIYPLTIRTTIDRFTIAAMVFLSGISSLMSFLFYGKFVLLLQADGCSFAVAFATLTNYLLVNAAKIIFILLGWPVLHIYVASAMLSLVTCLIYEIYRRKRYAWVDYHARPNFEAISQSKNVLVHQVSYIVCNSTDVIILTYVVGNLMLVSIYNLYSMIFEAVKCIIQNVLCSVNFIMGQTYNSDIEKYRVYHKLYELADFTISFILYSVAYVMILPFMELYTRGITDINYVDPKLPLLFVLIKLLASVREPAELLINYAGHFRKTQNRAVIEAGLNLAVSIVLARYLGIYGVLLGTVIALLYRTIDLYLYTSRPLLNRSVWYSIGQWALYISAFAGVMLIRSRLVLPITGYLSFFLYAAVVGICLTVYYCAVTLLVYHKTLFPFFKELFVRLKK